YRAAATVSRRRVRVAALAHDASAAHVTAARYTAARMEQSAAARPVVLLEASYRQLLDNKPNVAVLPWGATEAHNYHLPHGTDIIEATALAEQAAALATQRSAKIVVLPTIPFGNNAQQLDQVATISIQTATAAAI